MLPSISKSADFDLDWLLATELVDSTGRHNRWYRHEGGIVFDTVSASFGRPWSPTSDIKDTMEVEGALAKRGVSCELRHLVTTSGDWSCVLDWGDESAQVVEPTFSMALCRAAEQYLEATREEG